MVWLMVIGSPGRSPLRVRRTRGSNFLPTGSTSIRQPRSASTHSKIRSMMRFSNWSMSSVWLTAKAVRYMTSRLLRARASQESCGGSAAVRNIRLPSCWVTEWMIRDLSSGAAAAAMRIVPARSSSGSSPGPVYSISVPPTCTWSPLAKVCWRTRRPLTNVPLELFRSETA